MGKDSILGRTEESTMETMCMIRNTVMESIHGQMEENTKVSILMIKKKEKELSLGTMVVCTMDIGLTENRKGSAYTSM